ncbi:hypothetical protein [Streptomyces sp. SID12488]|uniref:hypothetical protein n=1 Tax=Streptomyces sp. SID12488 TaxID=2706040 RepID=UPI0013DBC814|nr:hypothetical protein [Streptomyces sp. SID12488]NEA63447.1 hypothetical protein [Streptomyces sp. SID12488]
MPAARHDSNRRPSVLAFARSLGISNTTFRRRYPGLVQEITARWTVSSDEQVHEPSTLDTLTVRNAKLRRRNREFTAALAIATARIQYVTLENVRFREPLEAQQTVIRRR